ncbi:MAG: efflux RND transporter periplasmic adaptor subunit [bacterium]
MKKIFVVLMVVVSLGLAGCSGNGKMILASGTVEIKEVDIASRISSRVMKILAEQGENVIQGQVLAELDDSVVAAQKEAAAGVFKQAQDLYKRNKNLFESHAISQQGFDNARTNLVSAQSQYTQAQVMYDEAKVKAPWSGLILQKHVEEGELVSPNTPLYTLGDITTAKVTIYLPLKDIGKIKYGQEAKVKIDSFEKKSFTGKITFIAGEAEFTPKNVQTKDERVKEVFAVEITVPNPEMILKPGIPADVEIR